MTKAVLQVSFFVGFAIIIILLVATAANGPACFMGGVLACAWGVVVDAALKDGER